MKVDLTVIPSIFDSVHAALAATVVGLLFLQVLFLVLAILALRRKPKPMAAAQVVDLDQDESRPAAVVKEKTPVQSPVDATPIPAASTDAALQLLNLLQNEARFLDFVKESTTTYSDAEIGSAARLVHDGCARVLGQYFDIESVRSEAEGSRVNIPAGFDAGSVRLTGNLVGSAPFKGTLVHRGWRVTAVKLPKVNKGHDSHVIAPAEVEL